jgi:hypothetical protein
VVHQLQERGYSNVRDYRGGIADWKEHGGATEGSTVALANGASMPLAIVSSGARVDQTAPTRGHQWGNAILDLIERRSTGQLFMLWLATILACGVIYWITGLMNLRALEEQGTPLDTGLGGLLTAIYFSFVTATSVGYGDVLPHGATRLLAVIEAVSGLLIFGAVVAKFVSRRQDELVREIHRITFEERLDRVLTNLHLVISELQSIATLCDNTTVNFDRIGSRLESAGLIFAGELRTVHHLLYHPQNAPTEPILASILANLASALRTTSDVMVCLPGGFERSEPLQDALRMIAQLSEEICADCVPQVYAPALREWMDRIQHTARNIR